MRNTLFVLGALPAMAGLVVTTLIDGWQVGAGVGHYQIVAHDALLN